MKRYSTAFLEKLYEHNIRKVHSKIELLDWSEKVLGQIDGIVVSGSYNVDGNSPVRRNVSLTLSVIDRQDKLVFDYIDLSRKVKVFAGIENYTDEHLEDEIIWFDLGTYVLIEPSYSHTVQELKMTLQAQDKMSLLNGTIGGVFNTATSFNQKNSKTGNINSLSWREIFYYAATLFGEEDPSKVVVESVPEHIYDYVQVKTVAGFDRDFIHVDAPVSVPGERIITQAWSPSVPQKEIKFSQTDRLYKLMKFGPPAPVVSDTNSKENYMKNAGEPISSVFSDIIENLGGTHEVFYNTNGDLILQKIHHFINDTFNPDLDEDLGYMGYEFTMDDYIPDFSGFPFAYDFTNKNTVTAYTNNPSWTNIKNDFIVVTKNGSNTLQVAIDKKPTVREIREWFIKFNADYELNPYSADLEFLRLDGVGDRMPYNEEEDTVPFLYKEATKNSPAEYVQVPLYKVPWQIALGLKNYMIRNVYSFIGQERVLPRWGKECESMIFKYVKSADNSSLFPNMGIFNPANVFYGAPWLAGYKTLNSASGVEEAESLDYSDPIFTNEGDPTFWMYFLDIIDENSKLGKYSIDKIGKRTIVKTSEYASTLFRIQPKSLVVMTEEELAELGGDFVLENLQERGQAYAIIRDMSFQMFKPVQYTAVETKGLFPYVSISGEPGENENQYFLNEFLQQNYIVGGYFSGDFLRNISSTGEAKNGAIAIKPGTFKHPKTRQDFTHGTLSTVYNEIYIPTDNATFISSADRYKSLQDMFIMYARNKGGRFPDSTSNDPYFIVVKSFSDGMKYMSVNNGIYAWKPFTFDRTDAGDVLVAYVNHVVNQSEYDDSLWSSNSIDLIEELFNIRDANLVSLFDSSGAVDCLSQLRQLMYQHTNLSEVITVNCLPIYHLEPNTLIRVEDERSNISGVFMITSFNIPFSPTSASLMSINAIKVYQPI